MAHQGSARWPGSSPAHFFCARPFRAIPTARARKCRPRRSPRSRYPVLPSFTRLSQGLQKAAPTNAGAASHITARAFARRLRVFQSCLSAAQSTWSASPRAPRATREIHSSSAPDDSSCISVPTLRHPRPPPPGTSRARPRGSIGPWHRPASVQRHTGRAARAAAHRQPRLALGRDVHAAAWSTASGRRCSHAAGPAPCATAARQSPRPCPSTQGDDRLPVRDDPRR